MAAEPVPRSALRRVPRDELFDTAFFEAVARLRIVARRVAGGGRFAEQRSKDMGSGIEFRDFRAYSPGDDMRAIDWNIYRRLGRVVLRLFEELEDLPLYLMPDVSASMFVESGDGASPRAVAGLRAALALAAISLRQHDTVGVMPFAEDLRIAVRPQAGAGRTLTLAGHLAAIEPGGPTDLVRSIRRLKATRLREGLVAIVSDFFDPRGIETVLHELGGLRHRLLLVQLARASDRDPDIRGDLRLLDCESGQAENVSVTPAVLASYRAAYDRFQEQLTEFARRRNAGFVRIDVDAPVVPQLAQLFESGALLA